MKLYTQRSAQKSRSMDVASSISSLPSDSPLEAYTQVISNASSPEELKQVTTHLLNPSTSISLVIARPAIDALIKRVADSEELLLHTLEALNPRISTFEAQVAHVRETLAARYQAQHEFLEAARVLQGISLESGQRVISDDYKLDIYIRIIRCLLEEDEAISADSYLNRASLLIHPNANRELLIHFKLSQARISDAKRRFMDASQKYLELSYTMEITDSERLGCLEAAMICGVLAPAGPARSRFLSTLYKDGRTEQLSNYKFFEKMFLDRLIAGKEIEDFAKTLKPHQLALLPDGTTVLSRAVIEHNLLAASSLYENIGIVELGELLGLDAKAAEKFARGMIESQRLKGEIDQVSGIIEFTSVIKSAHEGTETERWDRGIESLLVDVEACAESIEKKFPEWISSRGRQTMIT